MQLSVAISGKLEEILEKELKNAELAVTKGVTDYSNYNNRLVVDKNLDSIVEDDSIKLHWRISYYDKQKKVCDTKKPQKIAYRILEILFDC